MGSVYRAFDTKLQRRVALKLVRSDAPHGAASHARKQERLLREARAAAGIEHVNAIAIHDVGEVGDTTYIAMELVNGRSLREYVGDPGVPLETRLRWLLQAARALAAAHARGLVHRDVKPENVMVRDDGVAKVLDFGIASFGGGTLEPGSPGVPVGGATAESWSTSLSVDGRFVGTPRYMSPEQLRGDPFDARADQFAWGVMAYELLAGQPPWDLQAMTLSALADAQEKDAAPVRQLAPEVPPPIARIVGRAIERDPSDRFDSMAAVVAALEAEVRPPSTGRRVSLLVAAGVVAVTAAAVVFLVRPWRPTPPPVAPASPATTVARAGGTLRATHPRRITFEDGCEEFPAFTPDGRSIVFDATRGHDSVLVVKSLQDGTERSLTDVRGWDTAAQVSPDGKLVAFQRYVDGDAATWVVDFEGKQPPRRLADGAIAPSFTPDGAAVWCGDRKRMVRVEVASGHETRAIPCPAVSASPHLRELADGRLVVLYPGERGQMTGVAEYGLDGSPRWLTADPFGPPPDGTGVIWREKLEEAMALTPGGSQVVVSRDTEAGNVELFGLPLAGGEPARIDGTDVGAREGLALSTDGKTLAWSTCHAEQGPVRIAAAGKLVPLREAQPWLESAVAQVPGSRRLVLLSQRDGTMAPWVVDLDGKDQPRKLDTPERPADVAVSPDGSLVALELSGAGIGLVPMTGGPLRRLTEGTGDGHPRFVRDGKALLFTRQSAGAAPQVFTVPTTGGEPHPLLEPGTSHAAPSPGDGRIAYLSGTDQARLIPFLGDTASASRRRLSDGLRAGGYRAVAFSPDGKRVAVLLGASHVFEVDATTGTVLRSVDSGTASFSGLSYLGDDPVVVRSQWVGDLWLTDIAH